MKIRFEYKIAVIVALGALQGAFAQKKDENIGTEVVNVVKPYTPTVSDAFKVKETPVIEDDENTQKEQIEYNIFSFPVASTFTPAKGRAAGVEKGPREKFYNNYALLGVGNYGTVNAEVFVTHNLNRNEFVGGLLRHLSSQGGIDGVALDDNYAVTGLDLTYGNRQQKYSWNADLGYQNQMYNWYGLPLEYYTFTPEEIGMIDEKQSYNTITAGGNIAMEDSYIFKDASVQYKRFWDGFNSAENRFILKPSFDLSVMDEKIKLGLVMDYVGTKYDNEAFMGDGEYSYFNIGAQPSLLFQRDDFSVSLGAGLFYSMGKAYGESDSKFFVYPQVKASYKVVGSYMVAYAGAEGSLKQNSYEQFVSQNPFVSPTLAIAPTDQKYDVYVGLKGRLASNISYNVKGSYMDEDNKAFFVNNSAFDMTDANLGFNYWNSFGLRYGNLKTISFFGELKADFSKKVSGGVDVTYYSYDTDQEEAWNLPDLKVSANLDVNITEKWSAGTNIFFVGERKDDISGLGASPVVGAEPGVITLDSFFDLNAHVGYKYNDRLSGFLKLNNIANQDYNRWANYPVQGFQFMVGALYKFNL